jgi:hypothetical protein
MGLCVSPRSIQPEITLEIEDGGRTVFGLSTKGLLTVRLSGGMETVRPCHGEKDGTVKVYHAQVGEGQMAKAANGRYGGVQILGRQVLNGLEASSGGVWVGEERRSGIGVPEAMKRFLGERVWSDILFECVLCRVRFCTRCPFCNQCYGVFALRYLLRRLSPIGKRTVPCEAHARPACPLRESRLREVKE